MDWITPSPSQVNNRFWENYRQSKEDAIGGISMHSLSAMITSKVKAINKTLL